MKYYGGKARIAKEIYPLLNSIIFRGGFENYYEPFCGGLSITCGVRCKHRFASDICAPLITLYQALQAGWIPPDHVSLETYHHYRLNPDPNDPMTAFVGFGCAYSGRWFGGYARAIPRKDQTDGDSRGYAGESRRSLLRQIAACMDVVFFCRPYFQSDPKRSVIYCDPPYAGTVGYDYTGQTWDAPAFWDWVRRIGDADHVVVISEFSAPDDFCCIKTFLNRQGVVTKGEGKMQKEERLFMLPNQAEQWVFNTNTQPDIL